MLKHLNPTAANPARVVVIGAGGFVGGAVVAALERNGIPALPVTRKQVDLLQPGSGDRLRALLKPDDSMVFVSAIAPARNVTALIQNLTMSENALKALEQQPIGHLVYISSDAVYADDANPVNEASPCQPGSMHGMMHAARELVFRSALKSPLAILRPSLLYGAKDPHNGYGPNRFRRQAEKGEAITLFGEGEEMRDHVFIDDVGAIVLLALRHRSTGVLNVATGASTSFRAIAEKVVRLSGKPVEIRGTPRQNPVTHRHFDVTAGLKAFPEFRYTTLDDGLARAAHDRAGGGS